MAAIITNILSSTVGLLWNKARDFAAKKLKDGDTTHEKLREVIIRDLNDIKTTLNCLSRKDLLSSYSFLQEGVLLLTLALDQSDVESQLALDQSDVESHNETAALSKVGEASILNEAMRLAHAMKMLILTSDEQFKSAKDLFKTAREKATEAFWNESLNVKERIMACTLRVVARILECLENPDLTSTTCTLFPQELHGLSAIQEIFSVYLSGGLKSILNKAERFDNVKSVMLTNFTIFDFTATFASKYPDIEIWPMIELSGRNFNPARGWYEVWRQAPSDEILPPPKHLVTDELEPYFAVVNSRSEITTQNNGALRIISSTMESKVVHFSEPQKGKLLNQALMGIAVDRKDNVYAIRWLQTHTNILGNAVNDRNYVMYVLDNDYNVKHWCTLDFLDAIHRMTVKIATDENNDVIMIGNLDYNVYVCDSMGILKYKFERDQRLLHTVTISDKNEIMARSDQRDSVYMYNKDGTLKTAIKVPEGHIVKGFTFHYVMSKIIVLAYNGRRDSFYFLCYSKKGELESTMFIGKSNDYFTPYIASHPSGPVAFIQKRSITFI